MARPARQDHGHQRSGRDPEAGFRAAAGGACERPTIGQYPPWRGRWL